ncbi:hypothetical protein [Massilia sp. YMA4]|uniref:hypothetical protein n=1 Tax=Massilia sp. YMA4 TaxID=1593482 RepID=UPI0015824AD3|nr:hypothetical protein [Massilia sp. YMA4]
MDYIAARLAIRSGLPGPFLWSASQAVEKYLKCILMLNRVRTNDLGHDLNAALQLINESLPFRITLAPREREVFDHLAQWNGDRYLLTSFSLESYELILFDALVWKLRLYCQALDKRHYADDPSAETLRQRVAEVEAIISGSSKIAGHIPFGALEAILANKRHHAHAALVTQNGFFTLKERRTVRYRVGWQAVNSPLWLNPELAEVVQQWMKIPRDIRAGAARLAQQRVDEARLSAAAPSVE